MNVLWSVPKYLRDIYKEINPATLTGAIDVIVVEQENGDLLCSPFHVRFGKMGVMRSREKVVDIAINEEDVEVQMKLGDSGEAFFVEPIPEDERIDELPSFLATSPIPNAMEQMTAGLNALRLETARIEAEAKAQLAYGSAGVSVQQESLLKVDFSTTREKSSSHHDLCSNTEPFESVKSSLRTSRSMESLTATVDETLSTITGAADSLEATKPPEDASSASLKVTTEIFYDSCDDENLVNDNSGRRKRLNRRVKKSVLLERQLKRMNRGPLLPNKNHTWNGESASSDVPKESNESKDFSVEKRPSFGANSSPRKIPRSIAKEETRRFSMSYAEGEFVDGSVDEDHIFSMEISDSEDTSLTKRQDRKMRMMMTVERSFTHSDVQPVSRSLPSTTVTIEYSPVDRPQSTVIDIDGDESVFNGDQSATGNDGLTSVPLNGRSCFSDTDITPPPSPTRNLPTSASSDTEIDKVVKQEQKTAEMLTADEGEWKWGELPDVAQKQTTPVEAEPADSTTGWSRMFGFGWQTKAKTPQKESQGIYLDDLIKSEPKTAALYLSKKERNPSGPSSSSTEPFQPSATDDLKSEGKIVDESKPVEGQPIANVEEDSHRNRHASADSNDPRSAPLADDPGYDSGSKPSSVGGDEHHRRYFFDETRFHDLLGEISISLCGALGGSSEKPMTDEQFQSRLVSFQQFQSNPDLLSNQDLVVKVNNKYYNWKVAGPIILSALVFQRPLSQDAIAKLIEEHMPTRKSSTDNTQRGYSWFYWRRPTSPEPLKHDATVSTKEAAGQAVETSSSHQNGAATTGHPLVSITEVQIETGPSTEEFRVTGNVTVNGDSQRLNSIGSEESFDDLDDSMSGTRHRYRKTLRLSSEQLKKLKLKPGPNEARFSVTTKFQGTSWCSCHIYLWRFDDKIVISDIDGTITKSDVLGQILPLVGSQWAQAGVTKLFTRIAANGYKLVYLSARAIGQSALTKGYLRSVCQDQLSLPEGPLLLSPTSLMNALHREVIEKKPEEFKIKALNDVRALFPQYHNPFYAGYGNKINDVWAYTAVHVPRSRIFVINPKGEVHQHERKQVSSSTYTRIAVDLVDHMFPPLARSTNPPTPSDSTETAVVSRTPRSYAGFASSEDYSTFTYWYPTVEDDNLDLDKFKPPAKETKAQRAKSFSGTKDVVVVAKSRDDKK